MTTPAPSPLSATANLGGGDLPFMDCGSVCQIQLIRLVHQSTAVAGWLAYQLPNQHRQVLEVVAPESPGVALPDGQALTAEPFLDRLVRQATEVHRDVWAFCHRPLAQPGGMVYGLRFRDPLGSQWADLVLWQPLRAVAEVPPPTPCSPQSAPLAPFQDPDPQTADWSLPSLPTEVAALQMAIRLDQAHAQQQRRVHQYQDILRRLEHQLRHPLAMIHLHAANLHNSLSQGSDRQQAQTIREAVGHLSNQLTELIAGCQRSQVQAEICSVPSLWREAWQGVELAAQAKQVDLAVSDRPLSIPGDRAQLLQAFTNLLHNAVRFSPPQGQIQAQWQSFQREVVITLTDQGPGLSPMDFQHMFRPYYSTHPHGSGLGLTIARHIVQHHGGKLWADNLPQGGAQFSLVLPLEIPQPGQPPALVRGGG